MSPFHNPESDIWLSDGLDLEASLRRTTHLGIGAHQDDLEFMAYEGISACYRQSNLWFSGVTVTDGRGSSRKGPFASYTNEQIRDVRRQEQRDAAGIGGYSAQIQLDYPSSEIKGDRRSNVVDDLVYILERMRPKVVYLHQPADKHDSHVATLACCIAALRRVAGQHLPDRIIGCEVWRSLDWLADKDKIAMVCDGHPEVMRSLFAVYRSQIEGGKRYDLAVEGRRRSNATMFDSHGSDEYESLAWGVDLKPLVEQPDLSMESFILEKISDFSNDVRGRIQKFAI
ncbi:MAG: PIG-L family deacetylase [Opitutaceae bacterium]|nr:PIG-L family deacetylase [Opitutaceae bacterium]